MLLSVLVLWYHDFKAVQKTKTHAVNIIHKGISLTQPVNTVLVEVKDAKNHALSYYMDVESVTCGDSQCRVDRVRMYWDDLGRFNRIELPHGVHLEKAQGLQFSTADYLKLEMILKDENSGLKDFYKHELVSTVGGEGVDALSGATVFIEKSAYVEGAVWTCYTLWHWAHNDINDIIRIITGDDYSNLALEQLLEQEGYQKFAIEQLSRRHVYNEGLLNAIIEVNQVRPELLRTSLAYLETLPKQDFDTAIKRFYQGLPECNHLEFFKSMIQSEQVYPADFFSVVKIKVSDLSFQEIHLLLEVFRSKIEIDSVAMEQLVQLLHQNDFLKAREVYYFLKTQDLTENQGKVLLAFYEANKTRL
ncbi:hypothetical protein [Pseudotamlana agarivorans]|uniref:hypothetical protein n=1 Tax=Pseudotamlana agarivorans TaxID=481183 RepID=UPI001C08F2D4|nr:hypothetical protein [Tamlana agarivorans]